MEDEEFPALNRANMSDQQKFLKSLSEYKQAQFIEVSNGNKKIAPTDFTPMQILGKGSFGEVYLVKKNDD